MQLRGKSTPRVRYRESRADTLATAAIKLLLLTGARRGEILALQWEEVDLDRGCLRLKGSKTGAKVIRLAAAALSLPAALPRSARWVFPATKGSGHYVGLSKHWDVVKARANALAVRRAAHEEGSSLAGVPRFDHVRLHDLRHSAHPGGNG